MLVVVTVSKRSENGDQGTKRLAGFGENDAVSGDVRLRIGFRFHGCIVAEKSIFRKSPAYRFCLYGWDAMVREAVGNGDLMRLIG